MMLWGPDRPERFRWNDALSRLGLPAQDVALRPAQAKLVLPREGRFKVVMVSGMSISPSDAVRLLGTLRFDKAAEPSRRGRGRHNRPSSSMMAWGIASKLVLELTARHAFVPSLEEGPDGQLCSTWAAAVEASHDVGRVRRLSSDMPASAHAVFVPHRRPRSRRRRRRSPRIWHPERLIRAFLDAAIDDLIRSTVGSAEPPEVLSELDDRWEGEWLGALLAPREEALFDIDLDDETAPELPHAVHKWQGWLRSGEDQDLVEVDARTGLWLEMPEEDGQSFWFLRYMLVAADDPSLVIPAQQVFQTGSSTLRIFDRTFDKPQEQLLRDLAMAGRIFAPVQESLEQARPEGIYLDPKQAWQFISEAGPVLHTAGLEVRLPEELTGQGQRRLRARLRIRDVKPGEFEIDDKSHVGMRELAAFEWEAALGDEAIDAEAFRQIVALKQPLVMWRGKWVLIDPMQMQDIQELLDTTHATGTLSQFEALSRALSGIANPDAPGAGIEVVVEGEIASLIESLKEGDITHQEIETPESFHGTLRPYQARGLSWLVYQWRLGLGACLADDMGLGKTIQFIAYLLFRQEQNPDEGLGTLLVCPTSVVGNWERELNRFAPSIKVIRYHGSNRPSTLEALEEALEPHAVVITTYGLATRDIGLLKQHAWDNFALDEAQAIKNMQAKRSQAVREIDAGFRVALTGTPIENRLSELWSILDFLNPGLLGTYDRFRRTFALPIERYQDPEALERLKRVVGPFILRRVKTDPTIIQDLPEKLEHKVYCTLTREQATLYQALIDKAMAEIESSEGIARHGRVLAMLTHLKQVCNHPAQYLKDYSDVDPKRSGKFTRVMEMLEQVIDGDDRALIFTQFKQMGDLIKEQIQEAFDVEVPFLHGGVPQQQRDDLVASFQEEDGPPIFLLSLKAGGTGLNLTAANHVFHFDRWWNPAVEDQATDRAFRIGQKRNVQVHKMVSLGTLEEKIDTMLTEKRNLADTIVDDSGQAWLMELDTNALRELVSLSSDATLDDVD